MDKNLPKLCQNPDIPCIFDNFGQVFVFCRLFNKNLLKWFLLMICKEHILNRSTKRFGRNHPTLCFWLRRGWKMLNTKQLLYQADKNSHRSCSTKIVLKNSAIFTRKYLCWSLSRKVAAIQAFIKMRFQHKCFAVPKFLRKPILKNFCVQLLLNWIYEVIVWNFVSEKVFSKWSWLCNNTKIPVVFKPEF